MTHTNKRLLAELCSWQRCESCRRSAPTVPHHLRRRGHGGGFRVDVRCSIIALCMTCHNAEHAGKLIDADGTSCVLKDVARREDTTPEAIEAVLDLIARLDKGGRRTMKGILLSDELRDLDDGSRALCLRTLSEMGINTEGAAA